MSNHDKHLQIVPSKSAPAAAKPAAVAAPPVTPAAKPAAVAAPPVTPAAPPPAATAAPAAPAASAAIAAGSAAPAMTADERKEALRQAFAAYGSLLDKIDELKSQMQAVQDSQAPIIQSIFELGGSGPFTVRLHDGDVPTVFTVVKQPGRKKVGAPERFVLRGQSHRETIDLG